MEQNDSHGPFRVAERRIESGNIPHGHVFDGHSNRVDISFLLEGITYLHLSKVSTKYTTINASLVQV